jgi:hypothetical protein
VGDHLDIGDSAPVDPQRYFYGIPAWTNRHAFSVWIIHKTNIVGLPGQMQKPFPNLTRQGGLSV